MSINTKKIESFTFIVVLVILAIIYQPLLAYSAPQVNTDKNIYTFGEPIKVNFSDAPGVEGDWICIIPAGSPDTDGGNFQYIPKGVNKGVLTFDTQVPGKYEARAYYNYYNATQAISARYAFTVGGDKEYENLMSRKADKNNILEANLASGNGLVYIFREPNMMTADVPVTILANGKAIAVLQNKNYFIFTLPSGDVKFTAGTSEKIVEMKDGALSVSSGADEKIIKVKQGEVYYLKVALGWKISLEYVPHQEGANLIAKYKLKMQK